VIESRLTTPNERHTAVKPAASPPAFRGFILLPFPNSIGLLWACSHLARGHAKLLVRLRHGKEHSWRADRRILPNKPVVYEIRNRPGGEGGDVGLTWDGYYCGAVPSESERRRLFDVSLAPFVNHWIGTHPCAVGQY